MRLIISSEEIHYYIDDEGFAQAENKLEIPLPDEIIAKFTSYRLIHNLLY